MPIFEYQCNECQTTYDVYHKSLSNLDKVICPECNSENHKKLFSAFSASIDNSSGYSAMENSCADGSCGIPASPGGCASGMCGLN